MIAIGGAVTLPRLKVFSHCLRRRGAGDSRSRGMRYMLRVMVEPLRSRDVVRPRVWVRRIGRVSVDIVGTN